MSVRRTKGQDENVQIAKIIASQRLLIMQFRKTGDKRLIVEFKKLSEKFRRIHKKYRAI